MVRQTVYTSFDGDNMVYIDCMRQLAVKTGRVPINPEHALGYYLSTRAHGDSKAEVIKDCLSLVLIAEEFWVFADAEDCTLSDLPEGVLIEMLLWARRRNSTFRFLSVSRVVSSLVYGAPMQTIPAYCGVERTITENDIRRALSGAHFEEISSYLERVLPVLRPVVFIDIRDEDFKYADWARMQAYALGKIAIVPQILIPEFVYSILGLGHEYHRSVDKLRETSAGTWAIYESPERLELLMRRYDGEAHAVMYIPIKDLNVPKYANPRNWSITTKELHENLKKGG